MMEKLGDKDCDWCKGYGVALATVDNKKTEVQKCDNCNVFLTDSLAKTEVRNDVEFQMKQGIPTGKIN